MPALEQPPRPATAGRFRRWRWAVACGVLLIAVAGCQVEDDEDPVSPDASDPTTDQPCPVLDDAQVEPPPDDEQDVRRGLAELPLTDAVAAIPALDPVASALRTVSAEVPDPSEPSTFFAPTGRTESSEQPGTEPEAPDATHFEGDEFVRAHLVAGRALLLEELTDLGSVELADGGTLRVEEDGAVTLTSSTATAEVVCADLETRDGVVHVVDGPLFDVETPSRIEPEEPFEREGVDPETGEQLEDLP